MVPRLAPKWSPEGINKTNGNSMPLQGPPGRAKSSQNLGKPWFFKDFSRIQVLVFGSLLGRILNPKMAPKIDANSIAFWDGFLEQNGTPNGVQNATQNATKKQWKNRPENAAKNVPKRGPKMTPKIK